MRPQTLLVLVIIVVVGFGCQQKRAEEYRTIEEIEVVGECRENHVTQSARYSGSLVHSFNVTKGEHYVSGAVYNDNDAPKEVRERNQYLPPFSVQFHVTPEQVSQPKFSISGLSCGIGCPEPRYETTCQLKVVKRAPGSGVSSTVTQRK